MKITLEGEPKELAEFDRQLKNGSGYISSNGLIDSLVRHRDDFLKDFREQLDGK